jgi:non-homologous end joining protein Ku
MRSIWKGTISFGLVNIPISVGIATQRTDPKFRTLDRETLQPIKQQLFSPARGEVVDRDDTIKGYEVSKDQFLPVTEEGDALVAELLFYPEDVRPKEEIDERVREVEVTDQEIAMATQLVESLARPFDPDEFENEHKRETLALIERKLSGEEVVVQAEAPAAEPVPDLMAALKASIDQAKEAAPTAGGGDGAKGRSKAPRKKAATGAGNGAGDKGAGGGRKRATAGSSRSKSGSKRS